MTPEQTQQIFIDHITAQLRNDITYLESIGKQDTANHLREAIYSLGQTVNN